MEHKEGVKYELSTKTKAKDQIKANKKKTPRIHVCNLEFGVVLKSNLKSSNIYIMGRKHK